MSFPSPKQSLCVGGSLFGCGYSLHKQITHSPLFDPLREFSAFVLVMMQMQTPDGVVPIEQHCFDSLEPLTSLPFDKMRIQKSFPV